jgi:hypothetical protein
MINNIKNKVYSIQELFIILGVILLSKSLYYETYGTNSLLIVFFGLLLLRYNITKIKINKLIILYMTGFLFIIILNKESQYDSILVLVVRFAIALFIIHIFDFQKFSKIFIDIILLISFFSLFTWVIVYFNIHSFLPDFVGIDSRHLRNFIFFGVWENFITYAIFKNSGLWWEPGAFQVFVNLAFIFAIINKSINQKKYIIITITIITIGSTTGFIVFLLLSYIYFKRNITSSNKNRIIKIILFIFFFILISLYVSPLIHDKFNSESNSIVSFLSRYYDFIISYNMFTDNILIGYGFGSQIENAIPFGVNLIGHDIYYSNSLPTGADGITMFIAQCGILSFIFLIPFLIPKYYTHLYFLEKLIISLSMLLMFNTENFTFLLLFTVLTFYGVVGNKKEPYMGYRNNKTSNNTRLNRKSVRRDLV